jgi:hypothetical protein
MMFDVIAGAVREAWFQFANGFALYAPRALAMIMIAALGWLVAAAIAFVLRHLLGWVRFDSLARRLGAEQILRAGELPAPHVLVATIVFWLVWISFLIIGVDVLGIPGLESLAAAFVHFVPRLAVALLIMVLGFLAANVAWRATLLAGVNARLPSARLLSAGVRYMIVILAIAMAIEQIGVATNVVLTAFAIAFGAVMIGVGIALGIGGSGLARRMLEQQFPEREKDDSDRGASHL